MSQKVLSYDLGGTKVAVGVVNAAGKIVEETRVPVNLDQGKGAVMEQLAVLGREMLRKHPSIRKVGIASAGPLDPAKGILIDPTNFSSAEGTWGRVPITRILSTKLKRKVFLDNDAAAAILAEHWVGAAKKYKDAMILTLGTGLGTGIVLNGQLLRAGGGFHPEAGHMIIHEGDQSAPCGCGNLGCAEAYLSGRGFTRRNRARFANPNLVAKDIAELARKRDPRALAAFEEYSRLMAIAIRNYALIFAPQVMVFTGSFAEASDLFLKGTEAHLAKMMTRWPELTPKLKVSTLDNRAGLIGGAYVAFHRN